MKKIISINLSGRVIPIEDTAYEKLQQYVESLRKYFSSEEGRDEIINDIESRIAELMSEKVRKGAESVTDADVDEIAASMGRPEDFEEEVKPQAQPFQSESAEAGYEYTKTEEPKKKGRSRLYRDSSDKILGGVCSGFANYLNVDPAIIRLLFAIVTFGGFGLGVLLYIVMWIILPSQDLEGFSGKRLYRNPEDRIIGGVGSGLAAYFNKEAWVIRLIFAAPILLNVLLNILAIPLVHEGVMIPNIVFGSLSGTFVLAYIILWIVLPEARSEYQKMEMRGETVDVNKIRQTVKDRAKDFGDEVKLAAKNISAKAKEFSGRRGKEFASEMGDAARRTSRGLGHIIGVLFKSFFLFIAGTIAFALFVALLAIIFGGIGIWPLSDFFLNGFWQKTFAWGTLILFLGIPLIAFITWLIRRIMKVKSQSNYLGWTFGGLWALGWVSVSLLVASIVRDFRSYERVETPVNIEQTAKEKMIVEVFEPEIRYTDNFWWMDIDNSSGFDVDQDSMRLANVKIRVTKSEDENYHTTVWRYSNGRDRYDAEERARKIRFSAFSSDSVLNLGSGFAIDRDSKYRGQRVLVEIQVPVGKKIRFHESLEDMYHPFNIRVSDNRDWRNRRDRDYDVEWYWDDYFEWATGVDYVMSDNGQLINPNRPPRENTSNPSGGYRYESTAPTDDELDAQRKKVEEERNRLQELENRRTQQSTRDSAKNESMDDEDDESVGIGMPLLSLVQFIF